MIYNDGSYPLNIDYLDTGIDDVDEECTDDKYCKCSQCYEKNYD